MTERQITFIDVDENPLVVQLKHERVQFFVVDSEPELETDELREFATALFAAYVAGPLGPLLGQHAKNIEVVRGVARLDKGVVFSDLTASGATAFNKFIAYYLFPESRYAVAVTLGTRAKVSVGCNPWSTVPRTHEINKICERYGGGGHPVVGAVSVPKNEIERARQIAAEIVAELQS